MNDPLTDLWGDVYASIAEIEWFVSRKKDLAALSESSDRTWAQILDADIQGLREALAHVRQQIDSRLLADSNRADSPC